MILAGTLFPNFIRAQLPERWEQFRDRARGYYYTLDGTDLQNFTCLFTGGAYLNFVKQTADTSYNYPLKFIWTRQGKMYYVLQPYPNMNDPKKRQQTLRQIQFVKKEFHGFILDFVNFVAYSPFSDIPDDARIRFTPDSVRVSYQTGDKNITARVVKVFLPSGKLQKVIYESGHQRILNYPIYTEVNGKWLAAGWDTRIYENGEIHSGIATRLEYRQADNYWVPVRVEMLVQSASKPEDQFLSEIYLKDYLFNVPMQDIGQPETGQGEQKSPPAPSPR